MKPQLPQAWQELLADQLDAEYMKDLSRFLKAEIESGKTLCPPMKELFQAFRLTSPDQAKVVILGQDPYHGEGQAMGLAFSVPGGVTLPPSLRNIFAELEDDLGIERPASGDLTPWAKQGVLLLNSVLTTRLGSAGAHAGKGWERFTDEVIRRLGAEREGIVFILWGRWAQSKAALIDDKHRLISSPHPSPLSAHRGFFGSKPFSKANQILSELGKSPIDWRLGEG